MFTFNVVVLLFIRNLNATIYHSQWEKNIIPILKFKWDIINKAKCVTSLTHEYAKVIQSLATTNCSDALATSNYGDALVTTSFLWHKSIHDNVFRQWKTTCSKLNVSMPSYYNAHFSFVQKCLFTANIGATSNNSC